MTRRLVLLVVLLAITFTRGRAQSIDSILFTGRFDISDSSASFSHVSSSISANFQGTGISASFSSDYGVSYLYVILDRKDDPLHRKIIEVESGLIQQYVLAEHLEQGEHHVELVKLNQYDTRLSFHGFKTEGGRLLQQPTRPTLSMEYYGDSNAAGHSAWDAEDWGAASDNGGYFTFPGITARLLGAEYHNISMGGAGVTSGTWNLRDYYDLIHMNEHPLAENLWDFTNFQADVVVVNLGANDYYAGVTKANIKTGWKDFVNEDIRSHHPDAHIVLLNAYGWAIGEPADYLHEAVEELHAEGELNVSYLLIPWLWGQHHAVVNEHAGFANMLAAHIARELELADPGSSDLSSFAPHGQLSNGSFEKSTLYGVADGWRPHGEVELVDDSTEAFSGHKFLKLQSKAWANFANDAGPGETYILTGRLRSTDDEATGALKLEFKDQEQRTITSAEDRRALKQRII